MPYSIMLPRYMAVDEDDASARSESGKQYLQIPSLLGRCRRGRASSGFFVFDALSVDVDERPPAEVAKHDEAARTASASSAA